MTSLRCLLAVSLALGACVSPSARAAEVHLELLHAPPGFHVELLTNAVPNAREMALGRFVAGKGVLYVGSMQEGKVYAVELDAGKAVAVHTIAARLELPIGLAWRDGSLYVTAVSRLLRFDAIDDHLDHPSSPVVVTDRLPGETHHGGKFIAFGPDGKLYVPVGAPCNICEPDARHGIIQRMNADGSGLETVARGVRNSVGFDWSPKTHQLWFTVHGRDWLGDDSPADMLEVATRPGQHFGLQSSFLIWRTVGEKKP